MSRPADEHPNVVVFFTDQQRWDTSGLHGNPLDLMPNFDRLAQAGTHLYNYFTCQPVCGPARATLQTGLYPTKTGCFRNTIPLPRQARTLAHHFAEGGYTTGYVGKWHLGSADPVPRDERGGYQHWLASNLLEFTSDSFDTVVFDDDDRAVKLPGFRVDALTDAAIRFLDRHRDERFFLFLSHLEPHHQNHLDDYPPGDGFRERYTGRWIPPDLAALGGTTHQHIAGYYGMVKRLDLALGRLLDALRSLDLVERTIVLFTSDHGCHFKTRNDEYKRSCHDASVRVPAGFQGPGFDGGGQVRKLVSLVDLPPTLLDAAGLAVPPEMQGRSIVPLLRGAQAEWPEDVLIQISESEVGRAIRTDRWKYGVVAPDCNGWNDPGAARYVETHLYDLASDPYELANLSGFVSHREVAADLRARLIARMLEAGEPAPTIEPAAPRPSGPHAMSAAEGRHEITYDELHGRKSPGVSEN